MQLPVLVTSDLHLDAAPSCSYRWGIFPWLIAQAEAERAKTVLVLGDVTDKKDGHGAELVNRVVSSFRALAKVARVIILAGNHDWLREGQEFFRFLDGVDSLRFVTQPWEDDDTKGELALFLPHSKRPARDWEAFDLSHYRYVFMHQTARGSVSSNGQRLEGEELPDLSAAGKVYSGDIHVPQTVGAVEYVGSPYPVHFGDRFPARVVLIERGGRAIDLHYKGAPQRFSMTVEDRLTEGDLARHVVEPGDQVKLRIKLRAKDAHEWPALRRNALALLRGAGAEVHGIELQVERPGLALGRALPGPSARTPQEDVLRFVEREELGGDALDFALEVIER